MLEFRFLSGRSKYTDHSPGHPEPTAKIYVKVRFHGLSEPHYAQLDTGAAWSVLSPAVAEAAGILRTTGERARLSSRFGTHDGTLVRLPIIFLADEGASLETEGTFFIPTAWPSPLSFLGYAGLLDRIRFALDPQANDFYFGPV